MSVHTSELIEAVVHLPPGGKLTLYDVGWDEYEELLEQLGEFPGVRASYDSGRLEIVTPSFKHEKYKGLVHSFILVLADELDLEVLSYGAATLKIQKERKGAEADDCFYIQHAALIASKDSVDLRTDPPPDLVVEIDETRDSSTKLAIYAGFRVPEIWRYDGDRFSFLQLAERGYAETPFSRAFPFVSPEHLSQFVSNCHEAGHNAARRMFRDWVRQSRPRTSGE
ncbi:MAG: Uma2 family endonuclease [Acidobacteria bacterium]|nr:Uma2 family endonuclease [Acidobacteriota bacterium]